MIYKGDYATTMVTRRLRIQTTYVFMFTSRLKLAKSLTRTTEDISGPIILVVISRLVFLRIMEDLKVCPPGVLHSRAGRGIR